jgi:hypothetical protein
MDIANNQLKFKNPPIITIGKRNTGASWIVKIKYRIEQSNMN